MTEPTGAMYVMPAKRQTDKSLLKYILLSLITCGIYPLVVMSVLSDDVNIIASRYDGKRTMHYCLLSFVVVPLTCGVAAFIWYHNVSERIGNEIRRRGINYHFGAADFWLWFVLGSIILIGPFVYMHKLLKATNLMCADYNAKGL